MLGVVVVAAVGVVVEVVGGDFTEALGVVVTAAIAAAAEAVVGVCAAPGLGLVFSVEDTVRGEVTTVTGVEVP